MLSNNLIKGCRINASLSSSNHDAVQQSAKIIFKTLAPSSRAIPSLVKDKAVQRSVQTILKQFSRFSRTSLQSPNMSTCPKCDTRLIHPPSLSSLRIRFPTLAVDSTLDRSQSRCQHCDEMLVHQLATEAELPSPAYSNPITKLENTIKKLQDLIQEDIEDEDDALTLKSMVHAMQLKWANMVKKRDANIKDAWKPYWAIWGATKGQEAYLKG